MSDENKKPENGSRQPDLIAYAVTERGEDKSYFNRIGAAWANKKGGFHIKLVANPVNGEIVLFPPKSQDETSESQA